jgi:hypothetical protein
MMMQQQPNNLPHTLKHQNKILKIQESHIQDANR